MSARLAQALVAVSIIVAYSVLTALGDDGNALLGALAGQGLGAAIQAGAR